MMFNLDDFYNLFTKDIKVSTEPIVYSNDYNINYNTKHLTPSNRTYEISKEITERDFEFSTQKFLEYSLQVFTEIHKAIDCHDLESIRGIVNSNFYSVLVSQQDNGIVEAIEERIDRAQIGEPYLFKHTLTEKYEYLVVVILCDMEAGRQFDRIENKLIFRRPTTRLAGHGRRIIEVCNCPNCGANYPYIVPGTCKFCKARIYPFSYEWELTDFDVKKVF